MLRTDTEVDLGFRASYRGTFIVGGEALLRVQRSTSELEVIDRYRLSAYATVPLPLELMLSLIGALQYNHGLSASQQIDVVEDDENQNSLEVQLGRRIFAALRVDLRYALYANEFAHRPRALSAADGVPRGQLRPRHRRSGVRWDRSHLYLVT